MITGDSEMEKPSKTNLVAVVYSIVFEKGLGVFHGSRVISSTRLVVLSASQTINHHQCWAWSSLLRPSFPYWNIFLCLFSLDPWHSADHQSKAGHSTLSCLTEPLIFLTINHPLECTFTVSIFKLPYSPLPATLPCWHWVAKQYFP